MRDVLEGLSYQEQFTHFALTKDYIIYYGKSPQGDIIFDTTKLLSEEDQDIVSILVCDGIVVGVEVELREYYCSSKGTEFFNQKDHTMNSIGFRYGGYPYDFAEIYAKYSFIFNGN